jgi:hypothetical protein
MARQRNATQSRKVEPTIPVPAYARLERLAKMGLYGANPSEVARYLIIRGLDDLTRDRVLPPDVGGE